MAELNRLGAPDKKVGSFSLCLHSWAYKFPLNLASSTRSALVFSTAYLGVTRTAKGGGNSAQGRGRAIRSDNADSSSTDTKELQWYDISTNKVFIRYKTEKQVKIGLLYSKFMALWWESSDRFTGAHTGGVWLLK